VSAVFYREFYKNDNPMKNWIKKALLRNFLTVFLILSTGSLGFAAEPLSDIEKRRVIEKLYLDYQASFPEVTDVEPNTAARLAKEKNVIFIDTRKPKEQRISMLPGAITAEAFLENPEKYRGHLKIAYCTIAYRSGKFARQLAPKGFTIINLRGGIFAWVHDGGKVYDQDGPTDRIHVYGRKWDLAPETFEAIW
jgi:sodium/bile acid cotransporter 7